MKFPSVNPDQPKWVYPWLWAAGIYNLAWGAITIAMPNLLFDLTGAERLNYPEIWQCVGMIVGVYGIGYIIAAYDSRRHWPRLAASSGVEEAELAVEHLDSCGCIAAGFGSADGVSEDGFDLHGSSSLKVEQHAARIRDHLASIV